MFFRVINLERSFTSLVRASCRLSGSVGDTTAADQLSALLVITVMLVLQSRCLSFVQERTGTRPRPMHGDVMPPAVHELSRFEEISKFVPDHLMSAFRAQGHLGARS